MNNCLILVTLIMTLSLNVYCKPSSMEKTTAAVERVKQQNIKSHPFDSTIQGEDFDYATQGVSTSSCSDGIVQTAGAYDGAVIGYYDVDIGPINVFQITIRYSCGQPSGLIFPVDIYLDDPSYGYWLARFDTTSTGGWCTYREEQYVAQTFTTGVNDIYFVFHQNNTGNTPNSIDWFMLSPYY
ncbi:hypothetical protein CHUAL_000147 [Chamberlinius hualienensis]